MNERGQEKLKSTPRKGSVDFEVLELFRRRKGHCGSGMMKGAGAAFIKTFRNIVERVAASVVGGGPHDIRSGEQIQPFIETCSA